MHARADYGFKSRAISARVTKQIVTIFSKTCDKTLYMILTKLGAFVLVSLWHVLMFAARGLS